MKETGYSSIYIYICVYIHRMNIISDREGNRACMAPHILMNRRSIEILFQAPLLGLEFFFSISFG